jgi:hypothetical protein
MARRNCYLLFASFVLATFSINAAVPRFNGDTFDGTVLDTLTWEVSSPLGFSTVTQNQELLITSDGSGGAFCHTPELFGPGAGIALRKRLVGDFDIQVDFRNFQGSAPNYAAYLNIYQDQSHQLHIKRGHFDGGSVNGIQTVAIVGGPDMINGEVSPNPVTSGTFRITRSGITIQTFFDGALDFSLEAFDGPVIVSLVFGADQEFGSVAFDNFIINSGRLVVVDHLWACGNTFDVTAGPAVTNLALGKPTTASATLPGSDSSLAVDGSPWSFWNSGQDYPQWIEIDLGRNYSVRGIALWISMLPDGITRHSVWVRSEEGQWTEWVNAWTFEGYTEDLQRLTAWAIAPGGGAAIWAPVRYVRVVSEESPSWIAWREIEVYGYAAP